MDTGRQAVGGRASLDRAERIATPELVTAAPVAGARERVAFTFPGRYFTTDNLCDFAWQPKPSL